MIAFLTGKLIDKSPHGIILDVNGVGYELLASLETYQALPATGKEASLHIHTHVREDEIVLFGFSQLREKELFRRLIRVNGVGARLALNILSGIATEDLIQALRSEDLVRITAIPGIGKKTGERLILDLKDKLIDLQGSDASGKASQGQSEKPLFDDLLSVLLNLGYKKGSAEKALRQVKLEDDMNLQEAVRLTLKQLGNNPSKAGAA